MHSFFQPSATAKATPVEFKYESFAQIQPLNFESSSLINEDTLTKIPLIEGETGYTCNGIQLIRRKNIPFKGCVLEQQENNTWLIRDLVKNKSYLPEAETLYIFVTMQDGTIRIAPRFNHGHGGLAGYVEYVRYAGDVRFDDNQKIKRWSNNSTTFYPSEHLYGQAGFTKDSDKFFNDLASPSNNEIVSPSNINNNFSTVTFFGKKASLAIINNNLSASDKLNEESEANTKAQLTQAN